MRTPRAKLGCPPCSRCNRRSGFLSLKWIIFITSCLSTLVSLVSGMLLSKQGINSLKSAVDKVSKAEVQYVTQKLRTDFEETALALEELEHTLRYEWHSWSELHQWLRTYFFAKTKASRLMEAAIVALPNVNTARNTSYFYSTVWREEPKVGQVWVWCHSPNEDEKLDDRGLPGLVAASRLNESQDNYSQYSVDCRWLDPTTGEASVPGGQPGSWSISFLVKQVYDSPQGMPFSLRGPRQRWRGLQMWTTSEQKGAGGAGLAAVEPFVYMPFERIITWNPGVLRRHPRVGHGYTVVVQTFFLLHPWHKYVRDFAESRPHTMLAAIGAGSDDKHDNLDLVADDTVFANTETHQEWAKECHTDAIFSGDTHACVLRLGNLSVRLQEATKAARAVPDGSFIETDIHGASYFVRREIIFRLRASTMSRIDMIWAQHHAAIQGDVEAATRLFIVVICAIFVVDLAMAVFEYYFVAAPLLCVVRSLSWIETMDVDAAQENLSRMRVGCISEICALVAAFKKVTNNLKEFKPYLPHPLLMSFIGAKANTPADTEATMDSTDPIDKPVNDPGEDESSNSPRQDRVVIQSNPTQRKSFNGIVSPVDDVPGIVPDPEADASRNQGEAGKGGRRVSPPGRRIRWAVEDADECNVLATRVGLRRRNIAALFVRLVGFDSYAATIPRELLATTAGMFLSSVFNAVRGSKGMLLQFGGSSALVTFRHGPPTLRAVQCASSAGPDLVHATQHAAVQGVRVAPLLAVTTGACVVGNVGTTHLRQPTALGPAMMAGSVLLGLPSWSLFARPRVWCTAQVYEQVSMQSEGYEFQPTQWMLKPGGSVWAMFTQDDDPPVHGATEGDPHAQGGAVNVGSAQHGVSNAGNGNGLPHSPQPELTCGVQLINLRPEGNPPGTSPDGSFLRVLPSAEEGAGGDGSARCAFSPDPAPPQWGEMPLGRKRARRPEQARGGVGSGGGDDAADRGTARSDPSSHAESLPPLPMPGAGVPRRVLLAVRHMPVCGAFREMIEELWSVWGKPLELLVVQLGAQPPAPFAETDVPLLALRHDLILLDCSDITLAEDALELLHGGTDPRPAVAGFGGVPVVGLAAHRSSPPQDIATFAALTREALL